MRRGQLHVSYCTNVHPGEGLDAVDAVLTDHVAAVKAKVSPDAPLGLGLRLGQAAAATLATYADRRAALLDRLRALDLYVFTLNGFPYGDFAAPRVKETVYQPDWRDPARVTYTLQLAEALAAMPGPPRRTISTVAGGFRPDTGTAEDRRALVGGLGAAARGLADLADRTGVQVRLCLEPEPWTTLETTADALRFFSDDLRPLGGVVHDHLGLCYDCCHQAVQFEDAAASLQALAGAGVVIGKVQVSSALHLARPADADARAALLAFAEPRYLHQTVARLPDGRTLRALDLPELAHADADWRGADAWRTHFHVPIWWAGSGHLGTTRDDWRAAVRRCLEGGLTDHFEIETYTWDVIPAADRAGLAGDDLHASVAREFAELDAMLEGWR